MTDLTSKQIDGYHELRRTIIEDVCYRLRLVAKEYGQDRVNKAIIISPYEWLEQCGGHDAVYCATIASPQLGNVDFKIARCFADGV